MKTLQNKKLILNRIKKLGETEPAAPVRGLKNVRTETALLNVFERIFEKFAPAHTAKILERGRGAYNKTVYNPKYYISPELAAVIDANKADFESLEAAFKLLNDWTI